MDLNDAPFKLKEEHLARLKALSTTESSMVIVIEEEAMNQMLDSGTVPITEESEDNGSHKIDVLDSNFFNSVRDKVKVKPRKCNSIYRVHENFRKHNENAFTPQAVSIGPYHQGKEGFESIHQHKWNYLGELAEQNGEQWFEQLFHRVKRLEKRARECYSEEIDLSSNSFVEMMVLDGVFVLELFRRWVNHEEYEDDPNIDTLMPRTDLMSDLLKLENQMPYFILEDLFKHMNISGYSLMDLVGEYIGLTSYSWKSNPAIESEIPKIEVHHLLHLLHLCILPPLNHENLREGREKTIPSASNLHKAGIKFQKRSADSFLDVKFQKGVIEIPALTVNDGTEPVFLNLIAFERCHRHIKRCFTPYVRFMDCLINSAEDVEILRDSGIIFNVLGSNDELANMFKKLLKGAPVNDGHYLVNVFSDINEYYKKSWQRWRVDLMQTFWSRLGVILVVICTVAVSVLCLFGGIEAIKDWSKKS